MFEERNLGETQILAALIGVSEMVGNLADVPEVLRTVVRIAPQLVRVDRAAIFLYKPKEEALVPAEAYCPRTLYAEALLERAVTVQEAPRLMNKVIRQRLPSVIRNLPQEDLVPEELRNRWKLKSMLVVPLVFKGRALGFMTLDSTTSRHYFTSKEINVVSGIANQVATAIENGRLEEDLLRVLRKTEAVAGTLADAALKVDGEMRVSALSSPSERFFRLEETQLTGRRWAKVLHPRDGKGRPLSEMDFLDQGPLVDGELSEGARAYLTRGDGTKVYAHVHALPLRGRGEVASQLLFLFKKVPIPKRRERPEPLRRASGPS